MIAIGRFGFGYDAGSGSRRRRLKARRFWDIAIPGGIMRGAQFWNIYVIRMPNHDGVRFLRWDRPRRVKR